MKRIIFLLAMLVLFSRIAFEQAIPKQINYQGVLKDASGNVLTGDFAMTFKIYNETAGGSALWTEVQPAVSVANGLFSVQIGSVTPITTVPFNRIHFLGITVGTESELLPRTLLSPSPYSFMSMSVLDSAISSSKLQNDAVTSSKIANNQVVKSLNGLKDSVNLVAGSNVTITPVGNNLTISAGGSGGGGTIDGSGTQNYIPLFTGATTLGNSDIYQNAGGNIGVGTMDFSTYGQTAKFAVTGYTVLDSIRISGSDVGGNQILIDKPSGFGIVNQNGPMIFRTGGDSPSYDRMTITANGNVGIGNNSPIGKLHVATNLNYAGYFTSDSLSSATNVIYSKFTGATGNFDVKGIYSSSVPAEGFGYGGYFNGGYRGVYGFCNAGAYTGSGIGLYGYAAGTAGTRYGVFGFAAGGTNNYGVYASGNLAYTGSLINASDIKLKQNINSFSALAKILQLQPITFTYTSDKQYGRMNFSPGVHYGLSAQELEKVLPELVVDAVHPASEGNNGERNTDEIRYKGVKYMELVPILIQAVKEQQKIIEELSRRIEQLEQK